MSRARQVGNVDGIVRATLRKSFDPTGGFIKRHQLNESDRTAYIAAYTKAFEGVRS